MSKPVFEAISSILSINNKATSITEIASVSMVRPREVVDVLKDNKRFVRINGDKIVGLSPDIAKKEAVDFIFMRRIGQKQGRGLDVESLVLYTNAADRAQQQAINKRLKAAAPEVFQYFDIKSRGATDRDIWQGCDVSDEPALRALGFIDADEALEVLWKE